MTGDPMRIRADPRREAIARAERPSVPASPALVASAIDPLDRDVLPRWTLADLARQPCVDPFHPVRQFDRCVGVPPMAFLDRGCKT